MINFDQFESTDLLMGMKDIITQYWCDIAIYNRLAV